MSQQRQLRPGDLVRSRVSKYFSGLVISSPYVLPACGDRSETECVKVRWSSGFTDMDYVTKNLELLSATKKT